MPPSQQVIHTRAFILTAFFAIALAITRAHLQSITYDEAFSYLFFAKSLALVERFHTNNHILNSLLMWASTQALGPSNITLRLPALLGAAVYIATSYVLCQQIASRFILRLALFICLTCNPLILDFMVAARGYSLANAFFLAALAIPLAYPATQPLHRACLFASTCLGLSFTANFSFAIVDTTTYLALLLWALRRRETESIPRIAAYCTLPGLFVALAICGYPLAHWQTAQWKDDLWWGAHSLQEMVTSLIEPSASWLFAAIVIACTAQFLITRAPITLPACITLTSAGLSWLAFHFLNLPLPMGRTGIYFVPLCTLLAGAIAAAPTLGIPSATFLRRAITAMLLCLACYFLLNLRVSYFKEYRWNADVQEVHDVLKHLGATDIQSAGIYQTALNYYREVDGSTVPEFHIEIPEITPGHAVYVLDRVYWHDFIAHEKLTILYKGKSSDVAVASR